MRPVYPIFFSLVLLLLLTTCTSSQRVYKKLSDTEYTSFEYREVLEKWTREGSIHKGLGTELLVTATYECEEFRTAFVKEYGRLYMQSPQESQKMIDDQARAARDYDGFLVSIYTPKREWDDFAKKDSLWKVYLIRDGSMKTEPLEIRKVKRDRAMSEVFYPFISAWTSIYVFRFEKKNQLQASQSLDLVLASPSGSATLRWDL